MTLKDWLTEREMTVPEFAAIIGRTTESVRRYITGDRIPDKETMPLIAVATGGIVTPNDFFDLSQAVALCGICQRSSADPAIRACSEADCPHLERDAA